MLDACVLYPTVLREILMGLAAAGLFQPQWSPRILEEWARATRKLGEGAEAQARGEIALLRANWPRAEIQPNAADEARLFLPDPNDVHVLAAAIAGSSDTLLTFNMRDFPRGTMTDEGVALMGPDAFVMDLWLHNAAPVETVVNKVHATACAMAGEPIVLRALLKRARLPRLGKALA